MKISFISFCSLILIACTTAQESTSPAHYDIKQARKLALKKSLNEISGLAFSPLVAENTMYAIQDEDGKLFSISLEDGSSKHVKFGDKGDYEDLVFAKGKLFVLRSDGTIFQLSNSANADSFVVEKQFEGMIPAADYEGLATNTNELLVLCKTCDGINAKDNLLIYRLAIGDSALQLAGTIEPAIDIIKNDKKKKIFPSCLAQNPVDQNWYILSAENHLLMIFDQQFKYIESHTLNAAEFQQPEGIAFNKQGDLFISNEARGGTPNIMVIKRQ